MPRSKPGPWCPRRFWATALVPVTSAPSLPQGGRVAGQGVCGKDGAVLCAQRQPRRSLAARCAPENGATGRYALCALNLCLRPLSPHPPRPPSPSQTVRAAMADHRYLPANQVERYANLPDLETLRAQLVFVSRPSCTGHQPALVYRVRHALAQPADCSRSAPHALNRCLCRRCSSRPCAWRRR